MTSFCNSAFIQRSHPLIPFRKFFPDWTKQLAWPMCFSYVCFLACSSVLSHILMTVMCMHLLHVLHQYLLRLTPQCHPFSKYSLFDWDFAMLRPYTVWTHESCQAISPTSWEWASLHSVPYSGTLRTGWTPKIHFIYYLWKEKWYGFLIWYPITSQQATPIAPPKATPTCCTSIYRCRACLDFQRVLPICRKRGHVSAINALLISVHSLWLVSSNASRGECVLNREDN